MKIRKSIYAEPHKRTLKATEAEKTRAQGDGPRFPWMVTGPNEVERMCNAKTTENDDDDFKVVGSRAGSGDYRGW